MFVAGSLNPEGWAPAGVVQDNGWRLTGVGAVSFHGGSESPELASLSNDGVIFLLTGL